MEDDYRSTVHTSLTRAQTIMGCDRELYLSLVLICALVIVPSGIMKGQLHAIIFGIILWICGQYGLTQMGKRDEMMRHVFIRSLKYRTHYLATSPIPDTYKPQYRRW